MQTHHKKIKYSDVNNTPLSQNENIRVEREDLNTPSLQSNNLVNTINLNN